jgi:hypothetical protein
MRPRRPRSCNFMTTAAISSWSIPAMWNGISARIGVPVRLCGLLALGLGHATLQAWRTGQGLLAERVGHTTVALSGIAFLWQMSYGRVLPF